MRNNKDLVWIGPIGYVGSWLPHGYYTANKRAEQKIRFDCRLHLWRFRDIDSRFRGIFCKHSGCHQTISVASKKIRNIKLWLTLLQLKLNNLLFIFHISRFGCFYWSPLLVSRLLLNSSNIGCCVMWIYRLIQAKWRNNREISFKKRIPISTFSGIYSHKVRVIMNSVSF